MSGSPTKSSTNAAVWMLLQAWVGLHVPSSRTIWVVYIIATMILRISGGSGEFDGASIVVVGDLVFCLLPLGFTDDDPGVWSARVAWLPRSTSQGTTRKLHRRRFFLLQHHQGHYKDTARASLALYYTLG